MNRRATLRRLCDVRRTRLDRARVDLRAAGAAVAAAERECAACRQCVQRVETGLQALLAQLDRPEAVGSASRCHELHTHRAPLAADLERERYLLQRAQGELERAVADRTVARARVARLERMLDALHDEIRTLDRCVARRTEARSDDDIEELGIVASAHEQ